MHKGSLCLWTFSSGQYVHISAVFGIFKPRTLNHSWFRMYGSRAPAPRATYDAGFRDLNRSRMARGLLGFFQQGARTTMAPRVCAFEARSIFRFSTFSVRIHLQVFGTRERCSSCSNSEFLKQGPCNIEERSIPTRTRNPESRPTLGACLFSRSCRDTCSACLSILSGSWPGD